MKKLRLLCTLAFLFLYTLSYAQYATLLNFAGTSNGQNSRGSLISDGTYLYGMTFGGGANNKGTIFKILPNGTGFEKLLDFSGTSNGSGPNGDLIFDGTFLYGMTGSGGANNLGTIFKILPDGSGYVKLLDFAGVSNGSFPWGTLCFDGTYLYGTTHDGGTNNVGTIFKIMPDGTGFVKLLDFAGPSNGRYPIGKLLSDGSFLYGMTVQGGTNDAGTIFKIMPDGTGFVKIHDFTFTSGNLPFGSLISDGTYMYGMTFNGGNYNLGTIFKISPNGTGYVNLLHFAGATNGSYSDCSLIYDGTFLYGMTSLGGINDKGVVFKILPNGTGYVKLVDLGGGTNGSKPYGSLLSDGTFLYGMTSIGGTNNLGALFKLCISPPIATASNTGAYCTGSTIQLNATGGDSYVWNGPNSFTATTQNPSLTASNLTTSGTYTVTASNTVGCYATASTDVIIDTLPIATNTGAYCEGTTILLNASGGGTYAWSGPLSFTDTLQNPSIPSATTAMSGTYTLTATNACGTNTASTDVTVNALPLATAANTGPYCVWQPMQFYASGGVDYSWVGPYSFSSTLQNPSIAEAIMPRNGTYVVTVTSAEGCTSTASTVVTINVCAGLEDNTINGYTIYPNPTEDELTIVSPESKQQIVTISNVLGEVVFSQEISLVADIPFIIDLRDKPSGIYFLTIDRSSEKIIRR
jgi:uncharacterized repeat protein (TIGR03803 family)